MPPLPLREWGHFAHEVSDVIVGAKINKDDVVDDKGPTSSTRTQHRERPG